MFPRWWVGPSGGSTVPGGLRLLEGLARRGGQARVFRAWERERHVEALGQAMGVALVPAGLRVQAGRRAGRLGQVTGARLGEEAVEVAAAGVVAAMTMVMQSQMLTRLASPFTTVIVLSAWLRAGGWSVTLCLGTRRGS
jgi:hypothetical protein